jgi:hypothetical protein
MLDSSLLHWPKDQWKAERSAMMSIATEAKRYSIPGMKRELDQSDADGINLAACRSVGGCS